MRILLRFDVAVLQKYEQRSSPLLFEIAWEHEGLFYPEEAWSDFGCVILGWWFRSVINLLQGSGEEKLSFMDGPYSMRVKREGSSSLLSVAPEGLNAIWPTDLHKISEEMLRAANEVSRTLAHLGVGKSDISALQQNAALLRKAMQQNLEAA